MHGALDLVTAFFIDTAHNAVGYLVTAGAFAALISFHVSIIAGGGWQILLYVCEG